MTTPDEITAWIDKSALTELVATLSAAVDRADPRYDRLIAPPT